MLLYIFDMMPLFLHDDSRQSIMISFINYTVSIDIANERFAVTVDENITGYLFGVFIAIPISIDADPVDFGNLEMRQRIIFRLNNRNIRNDIYTLSNT